MLRSTIALLLFSVPLAAQAPLEFTIDPAQSNWSWTADSSLGPVVGVPNQTFQVSGTQVALLVRGALPIAQAQLSGGTAVVPTIQAEVPNVLPILPPLATIEVVGLSLSFNSPLFSVASGGAFSTNVTTLVQAGQVTIDPLVGSQTVIDLGGTQSDPQPVAGTISQVGALLTLSTTLTTTFDFTDPGSGLSATLSLDGDATGTYSCPAPLNYCASNPNSTGLPAAFSVLGSTRLQDNALQFEVVDLPANKFGYFLMSDSEGNIPGFGGSQGVLCLGSPLIRFAGNVLQSGAAGVMTFSPDVDALPGSATFGIGERWNFQCWYRDTNPGSTSNTSNALGIVFCP